MATVPPLEVHPLSPLMPGGPGSGIIPVRGAAMRPGALAAAGKTLSAAPPPIAAAAEGSSPPGPPAPLATRPPLPPIFDPTLGSSELLDKIKPINAQVARDVATNPGATPHTADEKALEDYALAEFQRNVNDGLRTGGFEPIFTENKVPFGGRDIVFLHDRVVIPGATVAEAQRLIPALQADAANPANAGKYTSAQRDLIKKLQLASAKDLPQTDVNTAREAAREAANTYLGKISGHSEPMHVVEHARITGVASGIVPSPPGPPQKAWDPIVPAQMASLSETFRGLVRIGVAQIKSAAGTGGVPGSALPRAPGMRSSIPPPGARPIAPFVPSLAPAETKLCTDLTSIFLTNPNNPPQLLEKLTAWNAEAMKIGKGWGTPFAGVISHVSKIVEWLQNSSAATKSDAEAALIRLKAEVIGFPMTLTLDHLSGSYIPPPPIPGTTAEVAARIGRSPVELLTELSTQVFNSTHAPTILSNLNKWIAYAKQFNPAPDTPLEGVLTRCETFQRYLTAVTTKDTVAAEALNPQATAALADLSGHGFISPLMTIGYLRQAQHAEPTPPAPLVAEGRVATGLGMLSESPPPRPLARGQREEEAGAASAAQVVTEQEKRVISLIGTTVFKAGSTAKQIRAEVEGWISQAKGLTPREGSQLQLILVRFIGIKQFFDAQEANNDSMVANLSPFVTKFLEEFKVRAPGFPEGITIEDLKLSETLEDLPSEDVSMLMAARSHFRVMDTDEAAAATVPLAEGARLTARESTQMLGRLKDILSGTSSDDNEKKLQRWLKEMKERPPTDDTPLAESMEHVRTILTCLTYTNHLKQAMARTGDQLGDIASDQKQPAEVALRRLKEINRDIPENVTLYSIIDLPKPMDRAFDSFDLPSLEAARTMQGARGTLRSTVRARSLSSAPIPRMRAESPPPLSVDLSESSVIDDDPEEDTPPAIQELDPLLAPAEELLPPLPEKAAPLAQPVIAFNAIFSSGKTAGEIRESLEAWLKTLPDKGSDLASHVEHARDIVSFIKLQQKVLEAAADQKINPLQLQLQGMALGDAKQAMKKSETALAALQEVQGFPQGVTLEAFTLPGYGSAVEAIETRIPH